MRPFTRCCVTDDSGSVAVEHRKSHPRPPPCQHLPPPRLMLLKRAAAWFHSAFVGFHLTGKHAWGAQICCPAGFHGDVIGPMRPRDLQLLFSSRVSRRGCRRHLASRGRNRRPSRVNTSPELEIKSQNSCNQVKRAGANTH